MSDIKKEDQKSDVDMSTTAAGAAAPAAEASSSTDKSADAPAKTEEKATVAFNEPLPTLDGKSPEEVQKLLSGAAKQINFYFSDANLPIDRYLFSLTCCNDPIYGWVPIKTLISFSRMRDPYQGLGVEFVAYALRQAIAAEGPNPLLGISESGENVRRVRPMERDVNGPWGRSVYVKGFGEEVPGESQTKILEYFEKFGDINAVRMRREDKEGGKPGKANGTFKGSVFVEFATQSKADEFLALESIPKYVPEGEEMIKMSKQQYVDKKNEERKAKGLPVDNIRTPNNGDNKEGGEKKYDNNRKPGRDGQKFNAFREMEKMKKGLPVNLAPIPDEVAIVGKAIPVTHDNLKRRRDDDGGDDRAAKKQQMDEPFELEYLGVNLKCDRATGKVLEPVKIPFQAKSALKFTGAGEKADWKDLKVQIMGPGGIKEPFLAAPPKEKGGRLAKKDNSSFTDGELEHLRNAKLTYGGVEVQWDHMTPAELQEFWAIRASFQGGVIAKKLKETQDLADETRRKEAAAMNAKDLGKHHGGGGRGGGGGGRGGGGGGRGQRGRGGRGGGGRGRGGNRDRGGGGNGLPPSVGTSEA